MQFFSPTGKVPGEPLEELAHAAFRNAPTMCPEDHGCMHYHRVWGLKRWLQLEGRGPAGAGLYGYGLATLRAVEAPRILVNGGADAGFFATIVAQLDDVKERCTFIFSDLCPTSIDLNRRFAEGLGLTAEFYRASSTSLDIAAVNAIVAHSFLGFHGREVLPVLFANWSRLLLPDGQLIFTENTSNQARILMHAERAENLAIQAVELRRLAQDAGFSEADADEVYQSARQMLDFCPELTRPSEEEVRDLIESNGMILTVLARDPNGTKGPVTARSAGSELGFLRSGFIALKRSA